MAVISLQASLLFELWVQRARTEPDQWDLSAGKSSQMRSLENTFPAVSQERTLTDAGDLIGLAAIATLITSQVSANRASILASS